MVPLFSLSLFVSILYVCSILIGFCCCLCAWACRLVHASFYCCQCLYCCCLVLFHEYLYGLSVSLFCPFNSYGTVVFTKFVRVYSKVFAHLLFVSVSSMMVTQLLSLLSLLSVFLFL